MGLIDAHRNAHGAGGVKRPRVKPDARSATSTSTGPDAFKFYTEIKTVIARWFSGIKDGTVLNFKALD